MSAMLLIALLGYYGYLMAANVRAVRHRADQQRSIAFKNSELALQSERGFDVFGHPIGLRSTSSDIKTLAFVLHGDTLKADLIFWSQVQALLNRDVNARLVGYCEDEACVDGVKHSERPPGFPIIAYGEITSSEAVINADMSGDSLLQVGTQPGLRKVPWRSQGQTPQGIVNRLP